MATPRRLTAYQRRIVQDVLAGIDRTDLLLSQISDEVVESLLSITSEPLTQGDLRPLLERINRDIDAVYGRGRAGAKSSPMSRAVEESVLDSVTGNLQQVMDDLRADIERVDGTLWTRLEAQLQVGEPGDDELKRIKQMLDAPEVQQRRDLVASFVDPERKWVQEDGYRLSDRIWKSGNAVRSEIDRIVQEAIRTGKHPNEAARELRQFLDPANNPVRYGPDGRITRREGEQFSRTDIRRANNDVRRIMRTELSNANFQTTKKAAPAIPGLIGLRYLLSSHHPKPDVCDTHATADRYGLGPGIYPPDRCPPIPQHPNCLCVAAPAVKSAQERVYDITAKYFGGSPTVPVPGSVGAGGGGLSPGGAGGSGSGSSGRPPDPGEPGEISPLNPRARRGPKGIWNEETLPEMDWESPHDRVVVPADLQDVLGLPTPVLRWDKLKVRRVENEHPEVPGLKMPVSEFLNRWEFAGPEPIGRFKKGALQPIRGVWNVFMPYRDDYMIAVIAIRHVDSYNFITMYHPRPEWLQNRVEDGQAWWKRRE